MPCLELAHPTREAALKHTCLQMACGSASLDAEESRSIAPDRRRLANRSRRPLCAGTCPMRG
jgi:hypothetical protein